MTARINRQEKHRFEPRSQEIDNFLVLRNDSGSAVRLGFDENHSSTIH